METAVNKALDNLDECLPTYLFTCVLTNMQMQVCKHDNEERMKEHASQTSAPSQTHSVGPHSTAHRVNPQYIGHHAVMKGSSEHSELS